jgi:hypothetical protein
VVEDVRVASADRRRAQTERQSMAPHRLGRLDVARRHRAVGDLDMIEQREDLLHVAARPFLEPVRPERMVQDVEKTPPAQPSDEIAHVAAQPLDLPMVGLVDPEHVDVQALAGVGQARLHLLADDDLRRPLRPPFEEPQRSLDRIVVGDRDVVHAGLLRRVEGVDRVGIRVVRPQDARMTPGGIPGMEVEVATPEWRCPARVGCGVAHGRDDTL